MTPIRSVTLMLLLGCSTCSEQAEAPAEPAARPVPQPEGLLLVVEVGNRALQNLNEAVQAPLVRTFLPSVPSDVVEAVAPIPPGMQVNERGSLTLALHGRWQAPEASVGFATLGGGDGGRRVLASDPDVLALSHGWLLGAHEREGIHLRVPDESVARLREFIEGFIDGQVRAARANIQREQERRGTPPSYGDPQELVLWLAERARLLAAYLPDASGLVAHIDTNPALSSGEVSVSGELSVATGSPAALVLAQEPTTPVPLRALPAGAALAWWRASPRPGWVDLLNATAGDRLSARDRATLDAMRARSDEGTVLAVGANPAAWAMASVPADDADPDAWMRSFAVSHVRELLGAFGCPGPASLRGYRVGDHSQLCPNGPWFHFAQQRGTEITVSRQPEFTAESTSLGPDAIRALPAEASGVLYLDPARLPATAGLFRLPAPEPPARETPIVGSWTADGTTLEFDVVFAPGALGALGDTVVAVTDS